MIEDILNKYNITNHHLFNPDFGYKNDYFSYYGKTHNEHLLISGEVLHYVRHDNGIELFDEGIEIVYHV